jgi:hypothetical protein
MFSRIRKMSPDPQSRSKRAAFVDFCQFFRNSAVDPVGAEEDHGLFLASLGGIGDNKAERCLIAVGLAISVLISVCCYCQVYKEVLVD